MSINGSLVGYEKNNNINGGNKKNRSLLNIGNNNTNDTSLQCTSLNSSISNSIITTESGNICSANTKHQNNNNEMTQQCNTNNKNTNRKRRFHWNSLWSIWYGILATLLQGILILHGLNRYLGCSLIQWKAGHEPYLELNIQFIFCCIASILLPLFFISSIFKVGNIANDGVKLATDSKKCSATPDDGLEREAKGGTIRALWTHGGPTSAFIHIISALCLLLPRLLLEARMIENGNLSRENIWRTELDFMVTHRDRLVVLSFMTSPYQNNTNSNFNNITNNHHNENGLVNIQYNNNHNNNDNEDDYSFSNGYEKTHLIEKFNSPTNVEDFFDTHQRIEMEQPLPLTTTTTTTRLDKTIRKEMLKSTTFKTPSTFTGSPINYDPVIEETTSTTGKYHSTTKTYDTINSKKHDRGGGGGQNTKSNHRQNNRHGSGKKHNQSTGSSSSSISSSRISKTTTTMAYDLINNQENAYGEKRKNNMNIKTDDDINEKLELPPNREFNFDKIGNFDVLFETTKNNINNNKDKMNAAVQSNIAIPSTDLPYIGTSVATHQTQQKPTTESSVQFTKKLLKDSEIHIVKTEKTNDLIIPSTQISSTDSKIIEIKPTKKNISTGKSDSGSGGGGVGKKTKRFSESNPNGKENSILIKPAALVGTVPGNITETVTFKGITGLLQHWLGVYKEMDIKNWSGPPSLEFLNFIMALIVWSARYPSVFWSTSKSFAMAFSFQMIANSIDVLLGFAGISVLYKLQIAGQQLPLQSTQLLLNAVVTLSLFILSFILIIASSLILYLYGHGRLSAKIRDRCIISSKSGETWAYFAHCASLCFVIALAVVKAPLMHDLSAVYRGSLDGAVLASALGSVIHIFLWIVLWLGLTAKHRWHFKLPPLEMPVGISAASQPLLVQHSRTGQHRCNSALNTSTAEQSTNGEETIYWPKLTPNSPKLKVTFNEVPSTLNDHDMLVEHDGKRNPGRRASLCLSGHPGEADDGDYATLRGPSGDFLHLNQMASNCDLADDTSEEGKLLACVRDDSVTYASTRDLEPPIQQSKTNIINITSPTTSYLGITEKLISPLAPVTVTVHTNEAHISSSSTPRCLRRADSGVPNEALTPRSETTSTESSTSPPERAPSETSSGVHSGEEKEEVLIRPRPANKPILKSPPSVIQEEPFGRSTNMKMSSFNKDTGGGNHQSSSATLPLTRNPINGEEHSEYTTHCNTMPLPFNCHQNQMLQHHVKPQIFTPTVSKTQLHTTLPNGIRYTNQHFLRRIAHVKNAESPYGILGLGAGHHTFSKLLQDPLCHNMANCSIPEDRDSANYSMISDHDREIYINSTTGNVN